MKRRTLTMVVGLLLCLSLIGVGFAAWVISVDDVQEVSGTIQVDEVHDQRLKVTIGAVSNNIIFGTPETMSATNPWLTNKNGAQEQLTATFTVKVEYESGAAFTAASDIKLTLTDDIETVAADALTANYITESVSGADSGVLAEDKKSITYTITVTFAWGSAFESKNPYTFFNEKDIKEDADGEGAGTDDWGDVASEALTVLYALNDDSYKVTVTTAVANK